jgi:GTPase SAR1 family protein
MQVRRRTSGANEAMFKIIMIGDSGTGKSCLLTRYTKDEFESDYKVTIGNTIFTQASNLHPKR